MSKNKSKFIELVSELQTGQLITMWGQDPIFGMFAPYHTGIVTEIDDNCITYLCNEKNNTQEITIDFNKLGHNKGWLLSHGVFTLKNNQKDKKNEKEN